MKRFFALSILLAACGGDTVTPPAPPSVETPKPKVPETPKITKDDLAKSAKNIALVPSPMETQRALEAAGIETQLSSLIPKHSFDMSNSGLEQAAVRTGVVLADLLLTVKTAEKADLLTRIGAVRGGMKQLQGGEDIDKTLVEYEESVKAGGIGRDDLLKEFDELSGAVIPELKFNKQNRVVPLIQAGSWLEGANLLARAVKAKGKPAAADGLLKQPAVVDYFIEYVKTKKGTPAQMAKKLEESLVTLKGLSEKKDSLTEADIDVVIKVTSDVLALL